MDFARYDRIVEHYPAMWPLLVPGYIPILNAMLDIVLAHSDRVRDILDLGCGPGSATAAVAPGCDPHAQITIVDGSRGMIDAAQRILAPHVREAIHGDFVHADTAARVFGPRAHDLILCSFALHHLTDPDKRVSLERAASALMPGGMLLLADEVATDRPGGWDVVERIRARLIDGHLSAGHINSAFWQLESSLPAPQRLPFLPARVDDMTSWLARAGLAVSCPVSLFGSALLIGIKPR